MVPGGGIEPPTRGFSIRCSTPELPGRAKWGNAGVAPLRRLVQYPISLFAEFSSQGDWDGEAKT